MPQDHQKAPGDGDDRFSRDEALGKPIEFTFPIGIEIHGCPGGFDQGGAKIATAGLGNATLSEGLSGSMHACAETGVTDQLFGRFKTGNITDGGQDSHTQNQANTGYLKGEGHEIPPLGGIAEGSYLSVQLPDQRLEMVEDIQVVAKKDFLHGRNGDGIPPGEVPVGERFAGRQLKHVAVKEALEPVAGHGLDPDQAAAMSEEAACLADMDRGNPNLGDEAGGAQLGELDGVVLVGLDPGFGDPGELAGIGNLDRGDKGDDTVIEIPGVGCGFDGDDVGREEMVAGPSRPFFKCFFERFEDDLLEGVDGGDIDEVFVEIDAEETGDT